jgi:hypothetical protein
MQVNGISVHVEDHGSGRLVEESGMGAEKLDVAVYTFRALNDLAEMAGTKDDEATRKWAMDKAGLLLSRFEQDWWMPERGLHADSLALNQKVPTNPLAALGIAPLTKLQQSYWTNATPMEINLPSSDHANTALLNLESSVFTGTNGFYQAGVGCTGNDLFRPEQQTFGGSRDTAEAGDRWCGWGKHNFLWTGIL